jgi:hypothetical protein
MTHTEVMAHLRALATPGTREPSSVARVRREALSAHIVRCSDCWQALATLHETVTGDRPVEDSEVTRRFGCEAVRDRLFALVGLDPAAIARDHAPAAHHLAWCLACRGRLAELIDVEQEYATAPRWVAAGERVREAVGRLVVRLGRVASGLVEIPDAFVLGPATSPMPVRGGPASGGQQSARFQVGDRDLWADLTVETADVTGAGLTLALSSDVSEPLSFHLREARADGDTLVARYSLRGTAPVRVHGLWPGSFVVELHDPTDARVHRVRLDIDAGT